MSVAGNYFLMLACDGKQPVTDGGCENERQFSAPTRFEALEKSADAGWLVTRDRKEAFCPAHKEIREQHRRKNRMGK